MPTTRVPRGLCQEEACHALFLLCERPLAYETSGVCQPILRLRYVGRQSCSGVARVFVSRLPQEL